MTITQTSKTQIRNTKTGAILTMTIEAAARSNDRVIQAQRRGAAQSLGLLEIVEPRIDAGFCGTLEIPVTEAAGIKRLEEIIEIQNSIGGDAQRVVSLATPHVNRVLDTDAGYMTHGQRVRSNAAAWDACQIGDVFRLAD
jgi:hypothetical protein